MYDILQYDKTTSTVITLVNLINGNDNVMVDHPKAGRRMLLIVGLIGMWFSTVLLVVCISASMQGHKAASYGAIAFVLLFVISFAAGA
ncbi:hypothetical protein OSTOST_25031, partial [Ostertagia ostertagi]